MIRTGRTGRSLKKQGEKWFIGAFAALMLAFSLFLAAGVLIRARLDFQLEDLSLLHSLLTITCLQTFANWLNFLSGYLLHRGWLGPTSITEQVLACTNCDNVSKNL